MSTVYTNIKNKKLNVETSNIKSPYGTGNKESGGEWWGGGGKVWINKITISLQCMQLGIFQTFITSGHCVVDLPTAYYPFGIFQTFITNGHCVVDLSTSNYHFGIFL